MLSFRSTRVVQVFATILLVGSDPSQAQTDCNGNGIDDVCDLSCGPPGGPCDVPRCGTSADHNGNATPVACDIGSYLTGYKIFDLGVPLGSIHCQAPDINGPGHVVGTVSPNSDTGTDSSLFYYAIGGMETLPPLEAGMSAGAPGGVHNLLACSLGVTVYNCCCNFLPLAVIPGQCEILRYGLQTSTCPNVVVTGQILAANLAAQFVNGPEFEVPCGQYILAYIEVCLPTDAQVGCLYTVSVKFRTDCGGSLAVPSAITGVCPVPLVFDADADGIDDRCDPCPLDNPDDSDGDSVCSSDDNCPTIPNPDQTDADSDGVGDVCDNCPFLANPSQTDCQANGVGDVCDISSGSSDDCNANIVPDECELWHQVIYVDDNATGSNDGSSWCDAYLYLQDAMGEATCGYASEIRVAQGNYTPDRNDGNPAGSGDRTGTFQLLNSVALRGGYAGGCGTPNANDRDFTLYETILSGEIGASGVDDNTCNVITGTGVDATAVLDGFTITAGYAYWPCSRYMGGGIYNNNGSPTISNCIISGNRAYFYGAGMSNWAGSRPTLTDCTFSGNRVDTNHPSSPGGAMYNDQSDPTVRDCVFSGNQAGGGGGAIFNNSSNPIIANCTFSGNFCAQRGGAMYNASSAPKVTNSTFTGNYASIFGGGMENNNSSPTLINCTFSGNGAGGGGVGGPPWGAGGMNNINNSSPIIINCSFTENSTGGSGGGMYNSNSSPTVCNSILWNNFDDVWGLQGGPFMDESAQIHVASGAVVIDYSTVKGWTGALGGTGNIGNDPLFGDADLRLSPGSPAIDAGNNDCVTVLEDLDGNQRIVNCIVDMGAYEFASSPCLPQNPACQDCNANGIPDECEPDCDSDGLIDACEPIGEYCEVDSECEDDSACTIDRCQQASCSCVHDVVPDCCPPDGPCKCSFDADCAASGRCCNAASHTCQPPPCLAGANRYLSLYPAVWWPGLFAPPTALRVTPLDLQNPVPPNLPQFPPPNFSAYESATCTAPGEASKCARWVGKPGTFLESQDSPALGSFRGARLQCTPYYHDWNVEGVIHVTGAEIVPSSIYHIESVSAACMGQEPTCTAVSTPAQITTTRSGDITERFNPPSTSTQPDALDVAAVVNKLKNLPGALVKAITQLQPNLPELNADVNALDIAAVVDAVKQRAYAFSGPCPCPSTVTCGPAMGSVACTTPSPCVTAFGAGALCVKTCTGGANDGDPCINNTHCPGTPAGTCGNGFCRDRCGRCRQ